MPMFTDRLGKDKLPGRKVPPDLPAECEERLNLDGVRGEEYFFHFRSSSRVVTSARV